MPTRLTKNFTREELQCHCGCGRMDYTRAAVERLQRLRDAYGGPIQVNSGYRCPTYNASVSSTGPNGPHTVVDGDSIAVDVKTYGQDAYRLLRCALCLGWRGIGVAQKGPRGKRFVHLDWVSDDAHPRPWAWSY